MTRCEIVAYWVESAEEDLRSAESLLADGHYVWALFLGHLVLEKLLKALYVKRVDIDVPRVHDLPTLARRAAIELDSQRVEFLEIVTRFNIQARYPDYKGRFRKKATREFASKHMAGIREARRWLHELIGS